MAWPGTLTTTEQDTVKKFSTNCRSWAAQLAQMNILGESIGAAWSGGISTIVAKLATGDVIPNDSGLADAQGLTRTELEQLESWAATCSNPAAGNQGVGGYASLAIQQTCVKAAGVNAVTGK